MVVYVGNKELIKENKSLNELIGIIEVDELFNAKQEIRNKDNKND